MCLHPYLNTVQRPEGEDADLRVHGRHVDATHDRLDEGERRLPVPLADGPRPVEREHHVGERAAVRGEGGLRCA